MEQEKKLKIEEKKHLFSFKYHFLKCIPVVKQLALKSQVLLPLKLYKSEAIVWKVD